MDAALADATRRSGDWLACHPGCSQCCIGVFAITQLDAARLRDGLIELQESDPRRAARIRERARESVARLSNTFPGDAGSGLLEEGGELADEFENFGTDEPCPALDPAMGTCDLYASRPITCRVFGPPVRSGLQNGLGVCELCFRGADEEEIAACEMHPDPDDLETELVDAFENAAGIHGKTIVAYALCADQADRDAK